MILIGSQRGGASDLANHLMKDENDHVLVHEVSGFASDNLHDAFKEADALSRGTRCRQFLFSLSINPPADHDLTTAQYEAAIGKVEDKLGLTGQPRAIVFHEKQTADGQNRRHAHAVWSRINIEEMKAIKLSHTKIKLKEVSRELHIEHGIQMPEGLADRSKSDPKHFSYEEWQQAQRFGRDPRERKGAVQDAWAISDNKDSFVHALEERGYTLAKGDKRGFVVLDRDMEVHSLARQVGIKAKDVKARLGDPKTYQDVEQAKAHIASQMQPTVSRLEQERQDRAHKEAEAQKLARQKLVEEQRRSRAESFRRMEEEQHRAALERQTRFRQGMSGLWDRVSGQHKRIQRENEEDAWQAHQRDQKRRDDLIFKQKEERGRLQREQTSEREQQTREKSRLEELRQNYAEALQKREGLREKLNHPRASPAPERPNNRDPTLER